MKTKNEYMQELARHIGNLPQNDRRELLADYEAHFDAGLENGKTEAQICQSLGSPKSVGQEIMMTNWAKRVESAPSGLRSPGTLAHIMMMIMILAPLNFFMLLCPFLLLFVLVISGWAIPIAIGGATLAAFVFFVQGAGAPIDMLNGLSLIFIFFGSLGITLLASLLMWLVTLGAFRILISFFKWNIDFINSRRTPASAIQGGRI